MSAGSSVSMSPAFAPETKGRKTCWASGAGSLGSGVGWGKGQVSPQLLSRTASRIIDASARNLLRILRLSRSMDDLLIAHPAIRASEGVPLHDVRACLR